MGTFVALDVAIGLVFMYLLLAIICTAINEWIAGLFRLRARNLKTAIASLVDDPAGPKKRGKGSATTRLSDQVLEHPLIASIKDGKRGPSYIPAPRFVAALRDVIEPEKPDAKKGDAPAAVAKDVENVKNQLKALEKATPPRIRAAAVTDAVVENADRDKDDRIEEWFNQAMERSTGWYRRKVMIITVVVATVLTVLSNADTIAAARILWQHPTVRAAVVAQAQERVNRPRPAEGGVFVQADYPDKDRPISDEAAGELEEDNPEDANTAGDDTEPASDDSGLTDAEKAALAQMIGWGRDFRAINTSVCAARQARINEVCKGEATTSPECTSAIDAGTAGGVCIQGSGGLEATDAFPKGTALWPLIASHFFGWFITAAAVSMGAPFWFDTLKLFMSVRSSGSNPDEKKKA